MLPSQSKRNASKRRRQLSLNSDFRTLEDVDENDSATLEKVPQEEGEVHEEETGVKDAATPGSHPTTPQEVPRSRSSPVHAKKKRSNWIETQQAAEKIRDYFTNDSDSDDDNLAEDLTNDGLSFEHVNLTKIQTAKLWDKYLTAAESHDKELVALLTSNIDTLLVFSGLLSAILTGFLVEVSKGLKPDPLVIISAQLATLTQVMASNITYSAVLRDDFKPSDAAPFVNGFLFASLGLSLLAATGAMYLKICCSQYSRPSSDGTRFDQVQRRQARFTGLLRWHLQDLVDFIPRLLYYALILLMIGILLFLQDLSNDISWVAYLPCCVVLFCAVLTILASLWDADCPFRPLSLILPSLRSIYVLMNSLHQAVNRSWIRLVNDYAQPAVVPERIPRALVIVNLILDRINRWLDRAITAFRCPPNSGDVALLLTIPLLLVTCLLFGVILLILSISWNILRTVQGWISKTKGPSRNRVGWFWLTRKSGVLDSLECEDDPGVGYVVESLGWLISSSTEPSTVTSALKFIPNVVRTSEHRRLLIKSGAEEKLIIRFVAAFKESPDGDWAIVPGKEQKVLRLGLTLQYLLGPQPHEVVNSLPHHYHHHALRGPLQHLAQHDNIQYRILSTSLLHLYSENLQLKNGTISDRPKQVIRPMRLLPFYWAFNSPLPYQADTVTRLNSIMADMSWENNEEIQHAYLFALSSQIDNRFQNRLVVKYLPIVDQIIKCAATLEYYWLNSNAEVEIIEATGFVLRICYIWSHSSDGDGEAAFLFRGDPRLPLLREATSRLVLAVCRQEVVSPLLRRHLLLLFPIPCSAPPYTITSTIPWMFPTCSLLLTGDSSFSPTHALAAIDAMRELSRRDRRVSCQAFICNGSLPRQIASMLDRVELPNVRAAAWSLICALVPREEFTPENEVFRSLLEAGLAEIAISPLVVWKEYQTALDLVRVMGELPSWVINSTRGDDFLGSMILIFKTQTLANPLRQQALQVIFSIWRILPKDPPGVEYEQWMTKLEQLEFIHAVREFSNDVSVRGDLDEATKIWISRLETDIVD